MQAVGYVQKERKQGLNYSFAGEAALIEALRPQMVEHGLVLSPASMKVVKFQEFMFTGQNPKQMTRVIVYAEYRLTHSPSGQSEILGALGEGMDHGDKATLKAMTVCFKYVLRQGFLIETGDDPDKTPSDDYQDRTPVSLTVAPKPPAATPKPAPVDDWVEMLEGCTTKDELQGVWARVPSPLKPRMELLKDSMKEKLSKPTATPF